MGLGLGFGVEVFENFKNFVKFNSAPMQIWAGLRLGSRNLVFKIFKKILVLGSFLG